VCLNCGRLIRGGSYCARCQPSRFDPRRGSGGRARAYRKRVLGQTGGSCVICGSTDRVEAHHLDALADLGDPEGEGVPLCFRCHRRVTAAERRARNRLRR
jgi:5-methylcytosine-specific restriction endonuclease McrA